MLQIANLLSRRMVHTLPKELVVLLRPVKRTAALARYSIGLKPLSRFCHDYRVDFNHPLL